MGVWFLVDPACDEMFPSLVRATASRAGWDSRFFGVIGRHRLNDGGQSVEGVFTKRRVVVNPHVFPILLKERAAVALTRAEFVDPASIRAATSRAGSWRHQHGARWEGVKLRLQVLKQLLSFFVVHFKPHGHFSCVSMGMLEGEP